VILGDVSGHGRNALARAAHMRYSLRAYLETGLDPRGALRLAGRVLDTDGDDLFTTVAIAVYNPADSTLTYASAGHPAPVVAGAATHDPVTCCASPAIGWGIPTGRRQTTIAFGAAARACFFSDGVTEARVDGELLGRERLGEIVSEVGTESPATEVVDRVRNGADSIHDDMAACVIEATAGAAAAAHVVEEFETDLRHLTAGQGERFLEACGVSSAAAAETLADAHRIATEQGSAVLRVEQDGESVWATALPATALMPATPAGYPAGEGAESGASAGRRRGSGRQALALPARG
jgi:Stage II sporulation protein E (SpoIIE)